MPRRAALDCGTPEHKLYQLYAGFMIFVYPVGIPLLYAWLLGKNRKALRVERLREDNIELLKTGFLWDEYHDRFWVRSGEERSNKGAFTGSRRYLPISRRSRQLHQLRQLF